MALADSVFSPPLRFADDLLLPIEDIERSQRQVEDSATGAMVTAIESETQGLLERADRALADGDVAALMALQWPVPGMLSRAIVSLWAAGFAAGAEDGLEEMRRAVSPVVQLAKVRRFALADDMAAVLNLEPQQLINTGAVEAVLGRANLLAGNFSEDVFNDLRQDLLTAIVPQSSTGNPISRAELLARIQKTLGVAESRASLIATTETTYAYNTGRMSSFDQSTLVDYVRVIAVLDSRTSEICRSRAGVVVAKDQIGSIGGVPPWHGRCRTTLGAVMSQLSRFQSLVSDPDRDPANRTLAPLPTGWRTTGSRAASTASKLPDNHLVTVNPRYAADSLDKALDSITTTGADQRVERFRAFVNQHQTQVVLPDLSQPKKRQHDVVKNNLNHQGWARGSEKILKEYTSKLKGASGYTHPEFNHIVVDTRSAGVSTRGKTFAVDPVVLNGQGDLAIRRSDAGLEMAGFSVTDHQDTKEFLIYLHEFGHQVHYKAGTPSPPFNILGSITDYGSTNEKEWFAEHFSLWIVDGERYSLADSVGAQFVADTLEAAIRTPRTQF